MNRIMKSPKEKIEKAKKKIQELSDRQDAIFEMLIFDLNVGRETKDHLFDYCFNDFGDLTRILEP